MLMRRALVIQRVTGLRIAPLSAISVSDAVLRRAAASGQRPAASGVANANTLIAIRPMPTSEAPRVTAESQAGKLATTETRQPFSSGSLRMTLVLDASGPERATAFLPPRTATAVAGMARPFATISVA